jgi:hypothetical protein
MSISPLAVSRAHDRGELPPLPAPADWDIGHVGFGDVLEALNPLQYLPGVGMIYREITGDSVHPALRIAVAGVVSFFLGGPIGLAATMIVAAAGEVASGHATTSPADFAQAAQAYQRHGRAAA